MQIEKHILTTPKLEGTITYGFADGVLVYYSFECDAKSEVLEWFYDKLPMTPTQLQAVRLKLGGKIEIIPVDISFEAFYNPYPNHRNRHRAEPEYKKLSEEYKAKAVISVPGYVRYLKRTGIAALLPENFIKKHEFLNNWDGL